MSCVSLCCFSLLILYPSLSTIGYSSASRPHPITGVGSVLLPLLNSNMQFGSHRDYYIDPRFGKPTWC
ncbi:hypothetical protein PF008_g4356 [Phytophthora fragariae]|uniref:RxLR effector protein n=3 Tax=Phytophthora TaxID=4783 RepID=A0A6G0SD89_9STRA|nr:hypothetical protein PF008_g4356 [Phytophthora fragariae]